MLEFERTYLLKELPPNLKEYRYIELEDIYIPKEAEHCHLRLRKKDREYVMTKKNPLTEENKNIKREHNIELTPEEYAALSKVEGKRLHKYRYLFPYAQITGELDIFLDDFEGLCIIDFEFENEEQLNAFTKPDFCLVEINHIERLAGGKLAGKKYGDIADVLESLGYEKKDVRAAGLI